MAEHVNVHLFGNDLRLLGSRGVYWQSESILFVADLHLGKEATFRRAGIPVPRGTSAGTLSTVSNMLRATDARRLIILGDLFHSRSSLSNDVRESTQAFLKQHSNRVISLVLGNHDQSVGSLPAHWPIEVLSPGERVRGIVLAHHPCPCPADADLLVCGHLHPSIRVGQRDSSLGSHPCYWLSKQTLVLPAVGRFTGTHRIQPQRQDQAWVVAENQVFPCPHDLSPT